MTGGSPMLRARPGPHPHTLADGTVVNLDRRLSREQLDVVAAVLAGAGVDPAITVELEVSEAAGWRVVWLDPDGDRDDPDWPFRIVVGRTLLVQH